MGKIGDRYTLLPITDLLYPAAHFITDFLLEIYCRLRENEFMGGEIRKVKS